MSKTFSRLGGDNPKQTNKQKSNIVDLLPWFKKQAEEEAIFNSIRVFNNQ